MDKRVVNIFLIEVLLPGFQKALEKKNNPNGVLKVVVDRAHRDVMIGARYRSTEWSKEYCNNTEYYIDLMLGLLKENKRNLVSETLIESFLDKCGNKINIGLAQKFVNMSLKYIYILSVMGFLEEIDSEIYINEKDCDCPIDRRIIDKVLDGCQKKPAWTKMENGEEYKTIQEKIDTMEKKTGIFFEIGVRF